MKTKSLVNTSFLVTSILLIASFLASCSDGKMKNVGDWNRRDRGTAIGGAGGAAIGGIVGSQSGNTAAGALIGGAAGAGSGALIGNELDKNKDK